MSPAWKDWILDASMDPGPGGSFVYCPIEGDIDGDFSVLTGFTYIGRPKGRVVAIWHPDGQEAVEEFCERYADELEKEKQLLKESEP